MATSSNVNDNLADDSLVKASCKGICDVRWMAKCGGTKIVRSETLVVPNLAMSLLSIPALAQRNIATLFLPGIALMFDLKNKMTILGQACLHGDGLYYIGDHQDSIPDEYSELESFQISSVTVVAQSYAGPATSMVDLSDKDDSATHVDTAGHDTFGNEGTLSHVCDPGRTASRMKNTFGTSDLDMRCLSKR